MVEEVAEGAVAEAAEEAAGVEAFLRRQDPLLEDIRARNTPLPTGNQEWHAILCGV